MSDRVDGVQWRGDYFGIGNGFQDDRALKALERYIGKEKTLAFLGGKGVECYETYLRNTRLYKEFRKEMDAMIKNCL